MFATGAEPGGVGSRTVQLPRVNVYKSEAIRKDASLLLYEEQSIKIFTGWQRQ